MTGKQRKRKKTRDFFERRLKNAKDAEESEMDEDLFALNEELQIYYETVLDALDEAERYNKIGSEDTVREAVKFMRPKKIIGIVASVYHCPLCGSEFMFNKDDGGINNYCSTCGQRLEM